MRLDGLDDLQLLNIPQLQSPVMGPRHQLAAVCGQPRDLFDGVDVPSELADRHDLLVPLLKAQLFARQVALDLILILHEMELLRFYSNGILYKKVGFLLFLLIHPIHR